VPELSNIAYVRHGSATEHSPADAVDVDIKNAEETAIKNVTNFTFNFIPSPY